MRVCGIYICRRLFLWHTGMQRVCSEVSFWRILEHTLCRRLKVCDRSAAHFFTFLLEEILACTCHSIFNSDLLLTPVNGTFVCLNGVNALKTSFYQCPHECTLKDLLRQNSQIHNYNTRQRCLILQPFARTNVTLTSFHISCIKEWKSLPDDIKNSTTLSRFRRLSKTYLLERLT